MDCTSERSSFSPIKSGRTVELVTQAIEEHILDGTLRDGDMLPSEEQLAHQLDVGRRSVREALKVLQAKGLVEVRMGVGAIVRRNDLDSYLDTLGNNMRSYLQLGRADARHVGQLRALLEGVALQRLTQDPRPALLEHLTAHLAGQRRAFEAEDPLAYQQHHRDFHQDIVDSLENPVISMVYGQVLQLIHGAMAEAGRRPGVMEQSITEHQWILDELMRGNVAEAGHALDSHLQGFVSNLNQLQTGELGELDATASQSD